MKRIAQFTGVAVFAGVALAGCSFEDDGSWRTTAAESSCEDSVTSQLKDPDSADFRNVKAVDNGDGTYEVTGEVNGRNSYGGMVGYKPFVCFAEDDGDAVTGSARIID